MLQLLIELWQFPRSFSLSPNLKQYPTTIISGVIMGLG